MSLDQNKALIRRFNDEAWNKGNLAVVDELFASNWVSHNAPPGMPPRRAGLRRRRGGPRARAG